MALSGMCKQLLGFTKGMNIEIIKLRYLELFPVVYPDVSIFASCTEVVPKFADVKSVYLIFCGMWQIVNYLE